GWRWSRGCRAGFPRQPQRRRRAKEGIVGIRSSGPEGAGEGQGRTREDSPSGRPVALAGHSARRGEPGRKSASVRWASYLRAVPCNRRRLAELRCARRWGGPDRPSATAESQEETHPGLSSNPVAPTFFQRRPFGGNVEGPSHCGNKIYVIQTAVQKHDFEVS